MATLTKKKKKKVSTYETFNRKTILDYQSGALTRENATQQLWDRNKGLAYTPKTNRHGDGPGVLWQACWQVLESFDLNRGEAKVSTFVYFGMQKALACEDEAVTRYYSDGECMEQSLSMDDGSDLDVIDGEPSVALLDIILERMDELSAQPSMNVEEMVAYSAMNLIIEGESMREICRKYGLTVEQVRQLVQMQIYRDVEQ